MNTINENPSSIIATLVPEEDRMDFLPEFFGTKYMISGENLVFSWMQKLAINYTGAYWEFYRLSNGGFYMAPMLSEPLHIPLHYSFQGNAEDSAISPDAAGIIAVLFTLGHLAGYLYDKKPDDSERFSELYHMLREYALQHPEGNFILNAID